MKLRLALAAFVLLSICSVVSMRNSAEATLQGGGAPRPCPPPPGTGQPSAVCPNQ